MKSVISRKLSVISKELFLCILSAGLLILSFPKFNFEFLAWFGFVPLFFAIQNKSKWKTFFLSCLTGIIFWLGIIYWLIHITFMGLILLVFYLALYFGIFGLIIKTYNLQLTTYNLIFIPSVWVILEYLRSQLFTGFGWALLGYSQYLNLPIIQIADITGVWGVSFLVMMVNAAVYKVLSIGYSVLSNEQKAKIIFKYCILPAALLLLSLSYGFYNLHNTQYTTRNTLKVSIIQGNIPQELKWQTYSQEFILDKYIKFSKEASLHKPDLIIWPEAAAPGFLFNRQDSWIFQNIFNLAKDIKTNLLIGTVVKENSDYFNSAVLIDSDGKIIQRYDKLHLVPFGEYIPLKRIFGFLQTVVPIGDFTFGKEYTIFDLEKQTDSFTRYPVSQLISSNRQTGKQANRQTKFAVLICFEDLFPELSRRFVKKGAGFLVNITNDAWFGRTSSPFQHVGLSVFRAIENRRFLIRTANTGVSGFIAPNGAMRSLVLDNQAKTIFIPGYKTETIYLQRNITFYTRYGDILVLLCLILVICGIIIEYAGFSPASRLKTGRNRVKKV